MSQFLIDANVLIRAHGDYYPIDRIPQFWSWLLTMAEAGAIGMPQQIYDEVAPSSDLLGVWLRSPSVRQAIVLADLTDLGRVQDVIARGYAPDLDDIEIGKIGQDPFLIAAALGASDRTVVTREVSKPTRQRANRKIPDVCSTFDLPCITDFALFRLLNFTIK